MILEQDSIAATVFERRDGVWDARALTAGDMLRMPEIEVDLPLAEVYADVELPTDTDDDTAG